MQCVAQNTKMAENPIPQQVWKLEEVQIRDKYIAAPDYTVELPMHFQWDSYQHSVLATEAVLYLLHPRTTALFLTVFLKYQLICVTIKFFLGKEENFESQF